MKFLAAVLLLGVISGTLAQMDPILTMLMLGGGRGGSSGSSTGQSASSGAASGTGGGRGFGGLAGLGGSSFARLALLSGGGGGKNLKH